VPSKLNLRALQTDVLIPYLKLLLEQKVPKDWGLTGDSGLEKTYRSIGFGLSDLVADLSKGFSMTHFAGA
jgi:hypothetical protein